MVSPAFGALSDKTGLVNRIDVESGGHVFEVEVVANFDVKDFEFVKDQNRFTLYTFSNIENNLGEVIIPNNLLNGNFTFYINDQEHFPKIKSNESISFITLNFTGLGNNKIDIIGDTFLQGSDNRTIEDDNPQNEGGGCLIATATFGSELEPQVQLLRELRDNKLLKTESGFYFMHAFNDIYYSFSPAIADYERENPVFKEVVKIAITPMLTTLSILNYVDMNSDESVVVYGIILILLNLSIYFLFPFFLIAIIKKHFSYLYFIK